MPPLGQQKVSTSETQSAVQPIDGSQQVGSWAQTRATQGSQPVAHSAGPGVQTSWHWQGRVVVVVVVDDVVEEVVVVGG